MITEQNEKISANKSEIEVMKTRLSYIEKIITAGLFVNGVNFVMIIIAIIQLQGNL